MTRTKEELIIENEELHSRLTVAEETLRAIQNGEVDAIVVSGSNGEQIYSLSSAETPYRTFIEAMNEGAVTLSKKGIIVYCNQRFAELVNEPIEHVIGSYFNHFCISGDKSKFDRLIARKTINKKESLTVSLINSLYLKLSIQFLPDYLQGDYYILVATDITEIKKKEKKLLELHNSLEQKLDIIQRLRMQLIDRKIDLTSELNKLKSTNKKHVKEITSYKLSQAALKRQLKLKQKKTTT